MSPLLLLLSILSILSLPSLQQFLHPQHHLAPAANSYHPAPPFYTFITQPLNTSYSFGSHLRECGSARVYKLEGKATQRSASVGNIQPTSNSTPLSTRSNTPPSCNQHSPPSPLLIRAPSVSLPPSSLAHTAHPFLVSVHLSHGPILPLSLTNQPECTSGSGRQVD